MTIWKVASDYGDGLVLSGRYRTEQAARRSLLPSEWIETRRALIDPTGRIVAVLHADGQAEGDLADVERIVTRAGRAVGWCIAEGRAWRFHAIASPPGQRPQRTHGGSNWSAD